MAESPIIPSDSDAAAIGRGRRALACCYGEGLMGRSPQSAQPPVFSGAVDLRGYRNDVLDGIHVSLNPWHAGPDRRAARRARAALSRTNGLQANITIRSQVRKEVSTQCRCVTRPQADTPSSRDQRSPQHRTFAQSAAPENYVIGLTMAQS